MSRKHEPVREEIVDRCARCFTIKLIDYVVTTDSSVRHYCNACSIALKLGTTHRKETITKVQQIADRLERAIDYLNSEGNIFSVPKLCEHAGTYCEYLYLHPELLERAKQASSASRAIALNAAIERLNARGDRLSMERVAREMGYHHSQQLKRYPELWAIARAAVGEWTSKTLSTQHMTIAEVQRIIKEGDWLSCTAIAEKCGISLVTLQRHVQTSALIQDELSARLERAIAHFGEHPSDDIVSSTQLAEYCKTLVRTLRSQLGSDRVDDAVQMVNAHLDTPSKREQITRHLESVFEAMAEKGPFTQTEFVKAAGRNTMIHLESRPELRSRVAAMSRLASVKGRSRASYLFQDYAAQKPKAPKSVLRYCLSPEFRKSS